MRGALEMYDTLLVKLLGKGGAGSKHGRGKLALFSEYAVRRADVGILEGHRLTCLDRDRLRAEGLHRSLLPDSRSGQHLDGGAIGRCWLDSSGWLRKKGPGVKRILAGCIVAGRRGRRIVRNVAEMRVLAHRHHVPGCLRLEDLGILLSMNVGASDCPVMQAE